MRRCFLNLLLFSLLSGFTLGSDTRPPHMAILFSGWVTGTFGPCGCKTEPNGGFPRRATFSRQFAEDFGSAIIQVDAGSIFSAPGPYSETTNDFMLQAMETLPIQVLNLGSEDLHMWPLLAGREEVVPRVISTNLIPRRSSVKQPERYAIVTLKAEQTGRDKDLRIGFLGIVDPSRVKPNSGFRGQDPAEAIAEVMPQLAPQVDFVVLLADYFRREKIEPGSLLHRIASANDEIYAILTTEREYLLLTPEQVNNAIILSSMERGRQLGRLVFEFDEKGGVASYEPDMVNLNDSFADDPVLGEKFRLLQSRVP